ncbi:hypothetical protein KL908_005184 [Ogataea polymorpha]|nr:hypothetical protein KL908_005184 [Ogataea polymorpha]
MASDEYRLLEANKTAIFHALDTHRTVIFENLVGAYSVARFLLEYGNLTVTAVENSSFAADLLKNSLSSLSVLTIDDLLWTDVEGDWVVLATSIDDTVTQLAIQQLETAKKLIIVNNYGSRLDCSGISINLQNPVFEVFFATSEPPDLLSEVQKLIRSHDGNVLVLLPSKKQVKEFATMTGSTSVLSENDLSSLRFVNQSNVVVMQNDKELVNSLRYFNFYRSPGFSLTIQSGIENRLVHSPLNFDYTLPTPIPQKYLRAFPWETSVLIDEKSLTDLSLSDPLVPLLVLMKKYENSPEAMFEDRIFCSLAKVSSFEHCLAQIEGWGLVEYTNGFRLTDHVFWKYKLYRLAGRKWLGLLTALESSLSFGADVTFVVLSILSICRTLDTASYSIWSLLYDINSKVPSLKSIESDFVTLANFFVSTFKLINNFVVQQSMDSNSELSRLLHRHKILRQIPDCFNELARHFVLSDAFGDSTLANTLTCLRKGLLFNIGVIASVVVTQKPLARFKIDPQYDSNSGLLPSLLIEAPVDIAAFYRTGDLVHWYTLHNYSDESMYPFLGVKGFKQEALQRSNGYYVRSLT